MILEPIDFSEKLIQTGCNDYGTNICWDCENYCGGCSWTAVDEKTGEVKFVPVPGWKTKDIRIRTGRNWRVTTQIVDCPLFKPDEKLVRK